MAITGITQVAKFCGASVIQLDSSAGWQEQVSYIQVSLVEDKSAGDRFIAPEPGTPLSFVFEGFRFDGLAQIYTRNRSVSGDPTYTVRLDSPTEILDAVQLILAAYRGINSTCYNLLNVFGFLEGASLSDFGGAGANESGIRWHKIRTAIESIQDGSTPFTPGIQYKGNNYIVDFGGLPIDIPDFYRVGGDFVSLNQVIQQVFQDSGYDYITQLRIGQGTGPHTIYFKSKSNRQPTSVGQINQFVAGRTDIVSFDSGTELRNDITSGVIFGGDQENFVAVLQSGAPPNATIWQFWGYQQTPFLIPFATQGNQPLVESDGFGDDHMAHLNATQVLDIVGGLVYDCSVLEMRFALYNQESWSCYIARRRPDVTTLFGLTVFPSLFTDGTDLDTNQQSFYATDVDATGALVDNFSDSVLGQQIGRLYNFVKTSAETYLGKQFIVRIPFFLKYYFEDETNKLFYNVEISDSGYWPDYIAAWNSGPLGLDYQNFNNFSTDQGKFIPFVEYGGSEIEKADLSSRSAGDMVIEGDRIYVRCQVDNSILFTPAPAALITIDEPLWQFPEDPVGGAQDVADLLDISIDDFLIMLDGRNGQFPIGIHPKPYSPIGVGLPLKSNEFTYGPWTKIGVPGKVRVEQNPTLVPWNYGGFATMDIAANAQLADIGTTAQLEESGTVIVTGAPELSLGDPLVAAGPIVTGIDVSVGPSQGITTTYRMRSQTPTYGVFSRQNADRIRRIGFATQQFRRDMRELSSRIRNQQRLTTQAAWSFLQNTAGGIRNDNANSVLQAFLVEGDDGKFTVQISSQTFPGSIGSTHANDDDKYKKTASTGWEGIFRPFSTNKNEDKLPHYEEATVTGVIGSKELNPFQKDNDILWAANGGSFKGHYTKRTNIDFNDLRLIGLRGPLWITGWGYDILGAKIPNVIEDDNETFQNMQDAFIDDYLKRFDQWKSGPVDLRWDKWRKVWASPYPIRGIYQTGDKVKIDGKQDLIPVDRYLGGTLSNGQKVFIAYFPLQQKWDVIAAACS